MTTRNRLGIEQLEKRELMAITASLAEGVLRVEGTDQPDSIVVRQQEGTISIEDVASGNGLIQACFNLSQVNRIDVLGKAGNDFISLPNLTLKDGIQVKGGLGADTLIAANQSVFADYDASAFDGFFALSADVETVVAAGGPGSQFVLTNEGDLYHYDPAMAGAWKRVFGGVTEIAADGAGRLFALTNEASLYLYDPAVAGAWKRVFGGVTEIAADGAGRLFALTNEASLYLYDPAVAGAWKRVFGGVTEIAADGAGRLFALTNEASLYLYDPAVAGAWKRVFSGVTEIAADGAGRLFALTNEASLYVYDPAVAGAWKRVFDRVTEIAADGNGRLFALTNEANLYVYDPAVAGAWKTVFGGVTQIAADGAGRLFALTNEATLYVYDSAAADLWKGIFGGVSQIAADRAGRLFALTYEASVYFYDPAVVGAWKRVFGGVTQIAADGAGRLFALTNEASLYVYDPAVAGAWKRVFGGVTKIAVDSAGRLFALTNEASLYVYDPAVAGAWKRVFGGVTQIAADDAGRLFALTNEASLYVYDPAVAGAWKRVFGGVTKIAADSAGRLFALTNEASLYIYDPAAAGGWTRVLGGGGPGAVGFQLVGVVDWIKDKTGIDLDATIDALKQYGSSQLQELAQKWRQDIGNFVASENTNMEEVRAQISAGGWFPAYGTLINEGDYAQLTAAAVATVITGNPALFQKYFTSLLDRNIEKISNTLPGIAKAAVLDALWQSIQSNGHEMRFGDIGVKAGIATYHRTVNLAGGAVSGSYFNMHQPYVAIRFYKPGTDAPILENGTTPSVVSAGQPTRSIDVYSMLLVNRSNYAKSIMFRWGESYAWESYYLAAQECKALVMRPTSLSPPVLPEFHTNWTFTTPNGGTGVVSEHVKTITFSTFSTTLPLLWDPRAEGKYLITPGQTIVNAYSADDILTKVNCVLFGLDYKENKTVFFI